MLLQIEHPQLFMRFVEPLSQSDRWIGQPHNRGMREGGHAGPGRKGCPQFGNAPRPQRIGHRVRKNCKFGKFTFIQCGGWRR